MFDLFRYQTADGREPFTDWLNSLRDRQAKARILARLERLEAGNFGDCEPCREGVSEFRIHWGAGYRVYHARGGQDGYPASRRRRQAHAGCRHRPVGGLFAGLQEEAEMSKLKATVSHRNKLIEELRADPKLAREYLAAAIEDDDPRVLLAALRTVAEMRGMARVAEAAGIPRESLYRTLSPKGNPRLSTLLAVIKAAGFRLSLDERKRRAA